MESELNEILLKSFAGSKPKKYNNYKGCLMFNEYESVADCIENFEVRDDDIWVCTFPKSGTTWMQEMIWNIANNLDFERAKASLEQRFPHLEHPPISAIRTEVEESIKAKYEDPYVKHVECIAKSPSPRFIKTHLPFHLLPRQLREGHKKSKIVYVMRNAKDTCISCYHFSKLVEGYCGMFEDYCKLFLGDTVFYAPYWNHVNGYLKRNDSNHVLCVEFEDMKCDLPSVIKKVATFLGKSLNEEQIILLKNHLSFNKMKENPSVNYESALEKLSSRKVFGETHDIKGKFMRSGEINQWKSMMSEELNKKFDDWIRENSIRF